MELDFAAQACDEIAFPFMYPPFKETGSGLKARIGADRRFREVDVRAGDGEGEAAGGEIVAVWASANPQHLLHWP